MKKNIKIHFIYPSDKGSMNAVRGNIQRFYREVVTAYINSLHCSHAEKKYIAEHIVSTIRASK